MEKRYRLYVVGPTFGFNFLADTYGYETYTDSTIRPTTKPHLIAFMGGTDIQPKLYGENPIAETESPDAYRDAKEIDLYKTYENIPKLGICRGAQLINVLNGGSLYQDVDGHEYGHHPIYGYGNLAPDAILARLFPVDTGSEEGPKACGCSGSGALGAWPLVAFGALLARRRQARRIQT